MGCLAGLHDVMPIAASSGDTLGQYPKASKILPQFGQSLHMVSPSSACIKIKSSQNHKASLQPKNQETL
jgi:hypothetical protein